MPVGIQVIAVSTIVFPYVRSSASRHLFLTYNFPLFCLAYATTSFLHPRIILVATMFNKIVPTSLMICLRRILITPNMNHLPRHSPNMNHLPKLSSHPLTHLQDSRVNILLYIAISRHEKISSSTNTPNIISGELTRAGQFGGHARLIDA